MITHVYVPKVEHFTSVSRQKSFVFSILAVSSSSQTLGRFQLAKPVKFVGGLVMEARRYSICPHPLPACVPNGEIGARQTNAPNSNPSRRSVLGVSQGASGEIPSTPTDSGIIYCNETSHSHAHTCALSVNAPRGNVKVTREPSLHKTIPWHCGYAAPSRLTSLEVFNKTIRSCGECQEKPVCTQQCSPSTKQEHWSALTRARLRWRPSSFGSDKSYSSIEGGGQGCG